MKTHSGLLSILSLLFIQTACAEQPDKLMANTPVQPETLFQWDFDSPNPLHNLYIEDESPAKDGVSVVPDPLNPSNKVLKTVLLQGNDRTEVSLYTANLLSILYFYADAAYGYNDKGNTQTDALSLGNEVWLSLKILKPQEQNTNGNQPCIVQLGPVSNTTLNPPASSSGFCQLRLRNNATSAGDSWNWRVFGGRVYTPAEITADNCFVPKPYGSWEKFVIHCKYSSGTDGLLEVWKDGIKYISTSGINAIPKNRFRIKFGVYLGIGNSAGQDLTCYFDDIKIGGSNSNYDKISAEILK